MYKRPVKRFWSLCTNTGHGSVIPGLLQANSKDPDQVVHISRLSKRLLKTHFKKAHLVMHSSFFMIMKEEKSNHFSCNWRRIKSQLILSIRNQEVTTQNILSFGLQSPLRLPLGISLVLEFENPLRLDSNSISSQNCSAVVLVFFLFEHGLTQPAQKVVKCTNVNA